MADRCAIFIAVIDAGRCARAAGRSDNAGNDGDCKQPANSAPLRQENAFLSVRFVGTRGRPSAPRPERRRGPHRAHRATSPTCAPSSGGFMRLHIGSRLRSRRWLAATAAGVTAVGVVLATQIAFADTAFSATFEDGSTSGWSKSGGTWSVVTDGSKVLQQSNTGSERPRVRRRQRLDQLHRAGLRQAADARIGRLRRPPRPLDQRDDLLPPRPAARQLVQLQAVNSGSVTVLGTASRTVATGTWYTLSIAVNGSAISGAVNGTTVGTATDTSIAKGRIGLQTAYSTANFDNVTVTTGGTARRRRRPPGRRPRHRPRRRHRADPEHLTVDEPAARRARCTWHPTAAPAPPARRPPDHPRLGDHPGRRRRRRSTCAAAPTACRDGHHRRRATTAPRARRKNAVRLPG